ncbi:unnamed protein product [Rotaria sp. Silwood2]|nr:unnamed protein product [Rotaria sp. Silwood2]CAF4275600.1 unnamed protein product [Rotaria sp. Silwood2]
MESNIPDIFEASGVVLRPDNLFMYIIFDNTFQIGVFCTWLAIQTINCTNKLLDWPDNTFNKLNSEFEGIAYNSLTDTYFIAQETIPSNVSPDEYNSNIFEVQIIINVTFSSINLIQSCRINWTFDSTSKGFEGIEFIIHHKRNKNYLLALCEANKCTLQSMSEYPVTSLGNGTLVVLEKHETTYNNSCQWESVGIINLPSDLKFRDYSALSAYRQKTSTYIAVTSQENSQIWIGIIEEIDQSPYFRITSSDKTGVYNLPRTIVNGKSLANELLLYLFEFLDGIPLLRIFHGLNSRFNHLLFIHFRAYRFDFRSISKYEFDIICRNYLPSITDQIISLTISDDDETPNLSEIFLSYNFTLDKFTHLQSLSLYSIQSFDQLNQLIFQCRQLPYLTHLYMIDGYNDDKKNDIQFLINNIWSLAKLNYFYLNYNSSSKIWLNKISIISLSIQKISIEYITCTLRDLSHLFKHTPFLQYLNTTIHFNFEDEQMPIITSSITSLKLTFESSVPVMINLFQMMPNLYSLTLKTMDIYLNGNKWKKILMKYLTKLKKFRLRMYFEFSHHKNVDEQLNKLIDTYKNSFWIEKHQWFIQCDCIPFGTYHHGILYTLPYTFDTFVCYDITKSKYTCPNEKIYWSYNRVKCFQYMKYKMNANDNSNLLPIQFPNIQHLKIGIPFDDNFWSYIPSLHRLTTLEVILGENYTHYQLQNLFNISPCLYSLRFFFSIDLNISLEQVISHSIRRLNFITKCSSNITHLNTIECNALAHSQLGHQCEVLLIIVENRANILNIIKTMNNLRSLIFQCKDDKWNNKDISSINDELVEWLRMCLPSTYSITRDKNEVLNIRIWISKNKKNTILS